MLSPCLKTISFEEYAAWFEQNLQVLQNRSPFHHPLWLKTVGEGLQIQMIFVGFYEGTELVAVIPGGLTRRGPFRLFGSPLRSMLTSYLGPVGLERIALTDNLPNLMLAGSQFIRKEYGVDFIRFILRDAPATTTLGPGWEQSGVGSYLLNLDMGAEQLWNTVKSRARRQIRKSERLGVKIVPFCDAKQYHYMLDETITRGTGSGSVYPERLYQVLLQALVPQQHLWVWGAEYESQIIAAGLFLHDDQEMHYVSGASLSQYRYLPTGYLLQWHAIKTAMQAGIQRYDLTGRGESEHDSVNHFKEAFSPEPITYWSPSWAPGYVRYAKQTFLSSQAHLQRFQQWIARG